jgi:tRNA A-37 threonylcarbamoyl transferase component Bud32
MDKTATVFRNQWMGTDALDKSLHINAPAPGVSLPAALKDTLRDTDRFGVLKTEHFYSVFSKSDFSESTVRDLIEHIDTVTGAARLLKNGNTCFVTAVTWNEHEYVIKRYNPKGLLHSLRHSLKRSRARRGWLNAHRLLFLGIPTPRPVAFIEEYSGWLLKRAWLITELAPGPKLRDYLVNPEITKAQKTVIIDKVFIILNQLEDNRITHGDLKHVNLIITPDGPTLIDLDSLKIHRTGLFYSYHRKKDMDAFAFHTP